MTKISELANAGDLDGTEEIVIVQDGTTLKCNLGDIFDSSLFETSVNIFSFIPPEKKASIIDGSNSDSLHLYFDDAFDYLSLAGGGTLFVPAGIYRMTSVASVPTKITVQGEPGTVFDVGNNNRLFDVVGSSSVDNVFRRFKVICSAVSAGAATAAGIIYRDQTVGETVRLVMDELEFDTAKNGRDAILLVARDTSPFYGVRLSNCRFPNTGRMNFEIIQHVSNLDPSFIDDLQVINNRFGRCGLVSIKIACSLSGAMRSPIVANNEFFGDDVAAYGLELVGHICSPRIIGNHFRGSFGQIISQSDRATTDTVNRAVIVGNTTTEGLSGKLFFGSLQNSIISGNVFDITGSLELSHTYTNNNLIVGNRIKSANTVAIIMDNSPSNRILNNIVDNTANVGNFATIRCYNTGATLNRIQNNEILKGTGGNYVDENTGATGNLFGGNIHGTFQNVPAGVFYGTATYDPASLVDAAGVTTTVTVTGAALGDIVEGVSFSLDLQGITMTAYVSSANTVSVRFQNETGGTIDLGSGTIRAMVRDFT